MRAPHVVPVLLAGLLLAACGGAADPAPVPPGGGNTGGLERVIERISASGLGGADLVRGDPAVPDLYLSQNQAGATARIRFSCATCRLQVRGAGVTVGANEDVTVTFPTLDASADVPLDVTDLASGASQRYVLHALPADTPLINVSGGPSRVPGEIFLTTIQYAGPAEATSQFALQIGSHGQVVFYRRVPGPQGLWDFKRTRLPGGAVRYSYVDTNSRSLVVLDATFRVIDQVSPLPFPGQAIADEIDPRDAVILADGHYILGVKAIRTVQNIPGRSAPSTVIASGLQEIVGGQAVWSWTTTEHPELYACSTELNDYASPLQEYAHWDSVLVDGDGDLLASFRHLDAVLKISRASGAVRWILGGPCDQFGLAPEQQFGHQHHARRTSDGRLSIFANRTAQGRSAVLLLNLDEAGLRLRTDVPALPGFTAFPGPVRSSLAMGSAQIADDGTLLVGWGTHTAPIPDVSELDPSTGLPVFQLTFASRVRGETFFSYRAVRYP